MQDTQDTGQLHPIQYYSSDCNATLLYSEKNGSITQKLPNGQDHTFTPDILRKDTKFYPADDKVFTTTDINGLRVWDAYNARCIYKYREDRFSRHVYSESGLLAAFDDYNVKFYDLRTRYSIGQLQRTNIKEVNWSGSMLCLFDGESLECVEYPLQNTCWSVQQVTDYVVCNERCFALQKNKLVSISIVSDSVISKRSSYSRIVGVKREDCVIGLEDHKLFLETHTTRRAIPCTQAVTALHAAYRMKDNYIIFVDDCLLEIPESEIFGNSEEMDENAVER